MTLAEQWPTKVTAVDRRGLRISRICPLRGPNAACGTRGQPTYFASGIALSQRSLFCLWQIRPLFLPFRFFPFFAALEGMYTHENEPYTSEARLVHATHILPYTSAPNKSTSLSRSREFVIACVHRQTIFNRRETG